MIRDPSDGSVKPTCNDSLQVRRLTSAENWGLTSLDRPERKPKPAPTKEELEAYYATHTLGGKMKDETK